MYCPNCGASDLGVIPCGDELDCYCHTCDWSGFIESDDDEDE